MIANELVSLIVLKTIYICYVTNATTYFQTGNPSWCQYPEVIEIQERVEQTIPLLLTFSFLHI